MFCMLCLRVLSAKALKKSVMSVLVSGAARSVGIGLCLRCLLQIGIKGGWY